MPAMTDRQSVAGKPRNTPDRLWATCHHRVRPQARRTEQPVLGSLECRCRCAVWLGCLVEVSGSLFDAATAGRVLTVRPSQAPSLPGVTAGLSAELWRA